MEYEEIIERMSNQKLYYCNDKRLLKNQTDYLEFLYDFNHTRPGEQKKKSTVKKDVC